MRIADRSGRDGVGIAVKSIERIASVSLLPFDIPQAVEASLVRAHTRLKLPDASIVAAARVSGAIAIIGNDRVWKSKSLGIQYIHLDDVVREQEEETR